MKMNKTKSDKRFISLGYKIMLFALIISTIPMFMADMILYHQASEMVISSEHAAMINSLSHIGANVETILNHVEELSVMLIQDNSVRAWLLTPKEDATLLARNKLAVEKQFTFSVWNKNYISSIQIDGLNGGRAFIGITRQPDTDDDVSQLLDERKGRIVWVDDQERWNSDNPGERTLALMRNVNDLNTGRKLGVLRVDVLIDALGRSFGNYISNPMSVTYMVDEQGKILASQPVVQSDVLSNEIATGISGGSRMTTITMDEEDYLVAVYPIIGSEWTLVNTIPTAYMLSNSSALRRTLITSLIFSFALCVAFAFFFSRVFTTPLIRLAERMRSVDVLDAGIIKPPKANDEVGILVNAYNAMSKRLNILVDEAAHSRIAQRESELLALQNQINPHALYNNLDTAYWMSQLENAPKTSEILWTLSQLYRMSMYRQDEIISVAEELTHLSFYRTLYEIRLDDSVRFQIDVEEPASKLGTVRFVLQPLVENAIQHAILPKGVGGSIYIRIIVRDGVLVMAVNDDGSGADAEFLNGVLEGTIKVEDEECLAIRNVNNRIRLRFGDAFGLIYAHNALGGLSAVMLQPLIENIPQIDP
jgi:two-component system, sensor histidine kinase YesM